MKTSKFMVAAALTVMTATVTAQNIREFFTGAAETTWLGIDFSHVKLIGEFTQFKDAGPIDPQEIRDRYFPAWNSLILNEPSKYDIKGMFQLSNLETNIDMITKLNAETPPKNLTAYEPPKYSCDDMRKWVEAYNLEGKKGFGIVFVAEALNKTLDQGSFYILVIDIPSKTIQLCEHMTGKTSGIGIRNYWAASIDHIITSVKKSEYKKWKTEYVK
ncbi:MAG TPA: hypothetical protein VMC08_01175 [Bacteroidales bacterium]|nr:hypothetical protein [Bacteroidales bacterium]